MDIYDNYRLASYAAAADAFNKGKNVISSFLPLIESTLSLLTGSSTPFLALQHQLNTIYHVDIPKATLRYLLDSLEVQEKIQYDGRTITLTDKFKDGSIYREDESKSEIEDFFFSFSSFLARKGQMASPSELRRDVCNWVYFHSCDLAEFINGKDLKEIGGNAKTDTWEYASDLLSFLIESKSSRSSSYSSFVKIFDGAVQASLLNFTPSKIDEVINSNISFENVILDTNFVLRLLNLQSAMDSETASATLASLQANKTNIYVLSQTIQEASSSIRSFLTETAPNAQRINRILSSKTIHTSGFLSALQRGISREKFLSLSQQENMREQLEKEYAITIIDDFDDVEIKQIHIDSLVQSKGLDSYKERQALHDLTLIKYCRKKRPKRIKNISSAKWWILTNDRRLTLWNQNNCEEYQECITETQLSNLLWMTTKKANNDDGLASTIVTLASSFAISQTELSTFAKSIGVYQEKYKERPEKLDNFALIFASNAWTTSDIRSALGDEESFERVVDEKIGIAIAQQEAQTAALAASQQENREKSDYINNLNLSLEKAKLTIDKNNIENSISILKKEAEGAQSLKKQIEDVDSFCQKITPWSGRISLILLLIPLLLILLMFFKYCYSTILSFLSRFVSIDTMIAFISGGILLLTITFAYNIFITLIIGYPFSPKEIFLAVRQKVIDSRKKSYVIKKGYQTSTATANLESLERDNEQSISEVNRRLNFLKSKLAEIDTSLSLL